MLGGERAVTLVTYHRGGGKSLGYPPNCLLTFRWALARGAAAIEYDTFAGMDGGHPRMVVAEPSLLAGRHLDIDHLAWHDLREIDAGNERFGPCPVATLAEVLDLVDESAQQQIHLKGGNPLSVPTLLEEMGPRKGCLVTSFSLKVLGEVKTRRPDVPVGWIVKPDNESGSEGSADLTRQVSGRPLPPYARGEIRAILERSGQAGVDAVILCAPRVDSADAVVSFRRHGFAVGCWGVGSNLELARRLIGLGVDRFTIDNPEEL